MPRCDGALEVFYKTLTEDHGLSKHPVLEGLSRGGLYVYNFAGAHPDQVGAIIGDNPVCDFKSWPRQRQRPGSAGDWKELINDYHFKDEAEALAYTKNPIDNLNRWPTRRSRYFISPRRGRGGALRRKHRIAERTLRETGRENHRDREARVQASPARIGRSDAGG